MTSSLLKNQEALMLIVRVFILLVCFPVHECAHAWTADKLGDNTGRRKGRITLNPLKHLDYMGTIFILLAGIGYAKPVPVNINNFKHRKRDFAITAAAGPISNLLMALIFLLVNRLLTGVHMAAEYQQLTGRLLFYAAYINVSLAVFNLIPIPPLDGSQVVMAFLPDGAYNTVLKKQRYTMGILLITLMGLSRLGYSPISFLTEKVYFLLRHAVGLLH